jgi:hypothetical protein
MASKDGKIPEDDGSKIGEWMKTAKYYTTVTREQGASQEQQNRIESEKASADKADELLAIVIRRALEERAGTFVTGPRGGKKRRKTRRKRKYTRWDSNPRSRSTGS